MSDTRPTLEEIGNQLIESQPALGVLIYGSAISSDYDGQGDIDLICISGNRRHQHLVMTCADLLLDIYAASRSHLEASIRRETRTNNNFVLDAFANGRCLVSREGHVESLMQLAREVWRAGPSEPSPGELHAIAAAIQKTELAVQRSERKLQISDEWNEITHIKLSHLFLELVYSHCRVHRLWGSSLWQMLGWTDPQYQDLLAMCRSYLSASSPHHRIQILIQLADTTLQRINQLTNFSIDIKNLSMDNPRHQTVS